MTNAITDPYAYCTTVIDVLRSMAADAPECTLTRDDLARAAEYVLGRPDLHRGRSPLTPQRARTKVRNALHNSPGDFTWRRQEKVWVFDDDQDAPGLTLPDLPEPGDTALPPLPRNCDRCGGLMAWQGYYTYGGHTGRVWCCMMCGHEAG